MILRPVRPQSPCGPPTTKRPVGLMKYLVLASSSSAGTTAWITFSWTSWRTVSIGTRPLCWVETITVSTRTGLSPSYSIVTWLLPSGLQVVEGAFAPHLRQPPRQLVRQHDRQRHQLLGLAAGVAEHQPLVAGAARVDAHRDVGRLAVDRRDHGAGLVVEAVLGAGVADGLDRLADDVRQLGVGLGRDLAGDEGDAGRDHRLAGHPAHRVLGEQRVEHGVRDLVGDLVGVPLGHGFGAEEMSVVLGHSLSWFLVSSPCFSASPCSCPHRTRRTGKYTSPPAP